MVFNAINAVFIGHLLVTYAIVLNLMEGKKVGVALAIAALGIAYVKEILVGHDLIYKWSDLVLFIACAALLVSSYAVWLL